MNKKANAMLCMMNSVMDNMSGSGLHLTNDLSVIIAVCTRQRPKMLERCLNSVISQQVPDGWMLIIIVVENDQNPHAYDLVDGMLKATRHGIRYYLERNRGIPFARNRALEEALRLGCDWLIFIDDDEIADEGWLRGYAEAINLYQADVIHGRVIYEYPKEDRWAYLLDNNKIKDSRIDGKVVHSAATNNVIISSRIFANNGMALRFNTAMQFSGGSDTEFFNRARLAGARIVYSSRPVVNETVPIERCTLRRQFLREARTAAASVFIDAMHYGKTFALLKHSKRCSTKFFQSIGYLICSLGFAFMNIELSRQRFLKAIIKFGFCYGSVLGISGKKFAPYKTIDGE